jgi:hypothetical protein
MLSLLPANKAESPRRQNTMICTYLFKGAKIVIGFSNPKIGFIFESRRLFEKLVSGTPKSENIRASVELVRNHTFGY